MWEYLGCEANLGEQLRDLLKKHGSFASMELEVKKTHLKKKARAKHGGFYTRVYLASQCHWTKCLGAEVCSHLKSSTCISGCPQQCGTLRPMIDNAFKWAASTNNLRRSKIHGEEEAYLLLSETFELLDEEGHEVAISGNMEVQVPRLH